MVLLRLVLLAVAALSAGLPAYAVVLVDSVVATVESEVLTASEVALAHRLGLFGFAPGEPAIDAGAVDRLVAVRLALDEARTLGLTAPADDVDAAWVTMAARLGGEAALDAWLDRHAVEREWARRLLADDVVWRRFVDLRFRAFVFVGPDELADALGPGSHTPEEQARARAQLVERGTERDLGAWIAERLKAVRGRRLLTPGTSVANPFAEHDS